MTLTCGMPVCGTFSAMAAPEPLAAGQAVTTITGTVLDESGEPLIGATVAQKSNPSNGTSTDIDGRFSLRVAPGTPLNVSYLGYRSIVVNAAEGMKVTLQSNDAELDEVVVVGYGSQRRANLTGAVSNVDVQKQLESRPQQDVAKALQGAVPGLTITQSNGAINGTASIKVRGTGSLTGSTAPLIVLDGVPIDNLEYLNPDDIAEISVLKDAASSSIYGTRAAFGVILITSKSGKQAEKMTVKYSNNFAWSQFSVTPELSSTLTQLREQIQCSYRNPGDEHGAFGQQFTALLPYAEKWAEQHSKPNKYQLAQQFESWDNVGDYYLNENNGGYLSYADWDVNGIMFNKAAPQNTHNVSLQGTTGKATYHVSFAYNKRQDFIKVNPEKYHRYNANANLQLELSKHVTAGIRFAYTKKDFTYPNVQQNIYGNTWRFPAWFSAYGYKLDAEGNEVDFRNTYSTTKQAATINTEWNEYRTQAWIRAQLFDGLSIQGDFTWMQQNGYDNYAYLPVYVWNTWSQNMPAPSYIVSQGNTTATKAFYKTDRWTMNVFGTYEKKFNGHGIKVMVGATAEENKDSNLQARTKVLIDNSLPALNLYTPSQTTTPNYNAPTSSEGHWATAGFFGRINYDYKGIYLLELNGRYDGSSKFPTNKQWAFFPSMSLGYRFSEEAWFEHIKEYVSNGKLRFSLGEIGNQAVGTNRFLSTISNSSINWIIGSGLGQGASMPAIVDPNLSWERVRTTDVGLDFGVLRNELTVGFDWYQRDTKDMLAPGMTRPNVLGTSAPYENAGSLRTRGWELSLNWNHSFGEWNVYAIAALSDAKTTITEWRNDAMTLSSNFSGKEYGVIYGFETDRYFTVDDFEKDENGKLLRDNKGAYIMKPEIASQAGLESGNFHYGPGDVKYKDLNGDGVINGGNSNMIELNGKYYVPGDNGYDEAKSNPNAKSVGTGTVYNHGDVKKIGNSLPRYEYSFHLGATWRGFDADIYCQGVGKRDLWTTSTLVIPFAQSANDIIYTHQLSHNQQYFDEDWNVIGWEVNQKNDYPAMYPGSYASNSVPGIGSGSWNFLPQTKYIQHLSYLRVKNITLGYTLPAALTQKAAISKLRIYVSGDNLFFIQRGNHKVPLDPEITAEWSGDHTLGRTAQIPRTYSFGLQVTI